MTLTQISTGGIKDSNVTTADIADQAVSLDKLPHGTSSNNGKFLRANNGADPTFETVNTDLVADTTPQLGGNLSTNGNNIGFSDDDKAKFGNSDDLEIFHQSSNGNSIIRESGGGILSIQTNGSYANLYDSANSVAMATFTTGGSCAFKHGSTTRLETTAGGAAVTISDNTTDAFTVKQASNEYITVDSNNSSELITLGNTTTNPKTAILGTGVGIGTASPTAASGETALNIYANEYPEVHLTSSVTGTAASDGSIFTLNNDNSTIIRNQENSYIRFDTNGSNERMRITSGGTVGIANTSPDSLFKLDVIGGARIGNGIDGIIIENAGSNASIANACNIRRHSSTGNLHITAGTTTARNLIFSTKSNGAEIARFTDTGLCFNGDTAAGNALDDYEEGSWTPVPSFGDNLVGASYSVANCQYTKIGRQVNIKGNINFTSRGSSTGGFKITGIPFTDAYAGSYSHSVGAVIVFFGPNSTGSMNCFTSSGSQVRFRMHNESNDNQEPTHSDIDNDTKLMFSITYYTS